MNKILIVDDEKNIQVSLASILSDEGYQVFNANDGEEALEKFKNIKPDAIFLDVWLPKLDGVEVTKRIMESDPTQVIVIISGHGSISTAVAALKAGAYDYLEKPLTVDKVVFVLKRAMEFRSLSEENVRLRAILAQEDRVGRQEQLSKRARDKSGSHEFEMEDSQYYRQQRTIAMSNIFYGIGLHSGEKTGLVVRPLPAGKGIRFENISEEGYTPARIEYLNTSDHATSLRKDKVEAKTIEHFMAVLHAFCITNLSIKIDREIPIDDGSAQKFCEFIRECGIIDQASLVPELEITRPLCIGPEGPEEKFIKVEPADVFTVSYTCVYPEPLGRQSYEFVMDSPEAFEREIAPARTFGFLAELTQISEMGLAKGGLINNFILIDGNRIINTTLRFPEELARHKILDIIGDFYLLGRAIRCKVTAQKTGHSENARMINLIKETFLRK